MSLVEYGEQKKDLPSVDEQYKSLIQKILTEGKQKTDPQGVGNLSIHGYELVYDLSKGTIPLIGLRDLSGSWRAIVGELLWIMSGSTNVQDLNQYGVHIWDKWAVATQKEFGYLEGELGPTYGAQWRHFKGGGTETADQLLEASRLLKENPDSRRIAISAWNPNDIKKVFVSPCIRYLQFHHAENELGLTVIQGSADVPLGVPFDTVEYSLLLLMAAKVHNMQPKFLKHVLVDAHIYMDQIQSMQELVQRESKVEPKLIINANPPNILDFKIEDFELVDYKPHPKIKVPAAL